MLQALRSRLVVQGLEAMDTLVEGAIFTLIMISPVLVFWLVRWIGRGGSRRYSEPLPY